MNKRLTVATNLNDSDYRTFLLVYSNHNSSLSLEDRAQYMIAHVVSVNKKKEENFLEVLFENGEIWHYLIDGTFKKVSLI